ncbi:hypothetical protein HY621_04190, partial [Candidatus Uhrbacteria bacterium]|nr:hypothetical protein [Candidatus Uhrbacteria bacterium]
MALQIGHRASYDFDLFTEHTLDPNLHAKIKKIFLDKRIKPIFKITEQYD